MAVRMKGIVRLKRVVILSLIGMVVLVPLLLFLFREKAVGFAMPLSDCVRPKSYLFLNPFRDQTPEKLAEQYLAQMKSGSPETVLSKIKFDSEQERATIWKIEKEQAPRKWLLQRRKDQSQTSTLIYAVSRNADVLQ